MTDLTHSAAFGTLTPHTPMSSGKRLGMPAAWAIAASLLAHSLGLGVALYGPANLIDTIMPADVGRGLEKNQIPTLMTEAGELNLTPTHKNIVPAKPTQFTWVSMPVVTATNASVSNPKTANKTVIKPSPKLPKAVPASTPESATAKPETPAPVEPVVSKSDTLQASESVASKLASNNLPVTTATTIATAADKDINKDITKDNARLDTQTPLPAIAASVENPDKASDFATASASQGTTQTLSQVQASSSPDAGAGKAKSSYQLPQEVHVRYETNYQGYPAKSELHWKKITDAGTLRYEASLLTTALGMEHRFKSVGIIGIKGLAPRSVEEKRPFKSAIATSVEPENNRVIISSREGFLPYDPFGHDMVSLMIQLGIYAQSLPEWSKPGVAQDFTVYRPSGVRRWRFQSQGLDTISVRGESRKVVYIKRIAADGQADYEDQHHFWLDPAHYGFPVKMRQIDNKGKITDIVMTQWRE